MVNPELIIFLQHMNDLYQKATAIQLCNSTHDPDGVWMNLNNQRLLISEKKIQLLYLVN